MSKPIVKGRGKGKKKDPKELLQKREEEKSKEFPEIIGFGKFEFQNKIIYIGSYKQLKTGQKVREGYGKVIHPTNDNSETGQEYFEGEWKNDKMEGFGIYHYSNGDVYEGDWFNNLHHGVGKYFFTDGNRYEGEWVDHRMHGLGKYMDSNNLECEGEFRDGCFFSKEQVKLKEEKRIAKKISKIKEIPLLFFKTWEETFDKVDKKTVKDLLSPFFAKSENMGLFIKGNYPIYEDYQPEYWNKAIRLAFGQPPNDDPIVAKRKPSPPKAKKKIIAKIAKVEEYPKPEIKINVPKNGNELMFMDKNSLLTPQLKEELTSGQVIEISSTLDTNIINIGIGYNRDLNRWLFVHFTDNQAPAPEKRDKSKAKTKGKGKGKNQSKK